MPTSNATNEQILKVLDKHLTAKQQRDLFTDLANVKGNSSFTKSIKELLKQIREKYCHAWD